MTSPTPVRGQPVERTPVTITSAQRTARPTTGWPSPSALSFREPMRCSLRTPQDKRLYRPLQPPHPPGQALVPPIAATAPSPDNGRPSAEQWT
jgi:hypothetical protein